MKPDEFTHKLIGGLELSYKVDSFTKANSPEFDLDVDYERTSKSTEFVYIVRCKNPIRFTTVEDLLVEVNVGQQLVVRLSKDLNSRLYFEFVGVEACTQ